MHDRRDHADTTVKFGFEIINTNRNDIAANATPSERLANPTPVPPILTIFNIGDY